MPVSLLFSPLFSQPPHLSLPNPISHSTPPASHHPLPSPQHLSLHAALIPLLRPHLSAHQPLAKKSFPRCLVLGKLYTPCAGKSGRRARAHHDLRGRSRRVSLPGVAEHRRDPRYHSQAGKGDRQADEPPNTITLLATSKPSPTPPCPRPASSLQKYEDQQRLSHQPSRPLPHPSHKHYTPSHTASP